MSRPAGVYRNPVAQTPEERRARVLKGLQLLRDGQPVRVIERQTGSALRYLKRWAVEFGLEWSKKKPGGAATK